ncbi:MAG: UDP-glucose/GDP-mannose dehydrogenase family protein [Myxococcaceae bacterium]
MKIVLIGTGYVGLVSGACFAELGFDVTCVDKDLDKLRKLENSILPFYEPGLSDYVKKNTQTGRLRFTSILDDTISAAEVIIIAVGTPCDSNTGRADLKELYAALDLIAPFLDENKLVILKSTVPIGTAKKVQDYLNIEVASNPEFLREGSAIQDFMRPVRIVIGTESNVARKTLRRLYQRFLSNHVPIIETTQNTAEIIKYASNAFLGMKISFINQIADLCENCNGDVRAVSQALGLDNRIGKEFLSPGPGFGGSCFTKDLQELKLCAEKFEAPQGIVSQVLAYNNSRPLRMLEIIQAAFEGDFRNKTLAILGLTFKANTDDLRDSPSMKIISLLSGLGLRIRVYDPKGMESASKTLFNVVFAGDSYEAIKDSDGLVILTEWQEFKSLNLERVKRLLKAPLIVDLRNIFSLEDMKAKGFTYYSLGHSPVNGRRYA